MTKAFDLACFIPANATVVGDTVAVTQASPMRTNWIAPGGIADAPNDGTAYARKSLGWAHLTHNDITDWAATLAGYYPTTNPAGYQTAAQVTAAIAASAYVLPTASTLTLGGVKVDGTTITVTGGVISSTGGSGGLADAPSDGTTYARNNTNWVHLSHNDITDWAASVPAPYVLPTASTSVLGGVKVDGSTITISGGVISSAGGTGGLTDAPSDGHIYGRQNAAWTAVDAMTIDCGTF